MLVRSMSRSRKKTPIFGLTTATTDKPFKLAEHRRERRVTKSTLVTESDALPDQRHFGNPYASEKDGKRWYAKAQPKDMRK